MCLRLHALPSLATVLLALGSLAAATPFPPARQEGIDRDAIESRVDGSLRWLRAQQDVETGSYGGVLETARALYSLATSHRSYRPSDGPFVSAGVRYLVGRARADGAVTEREGTGAEVRHETGWALRALEALGVRNGTLDAGRRFLGDDADEPRTEPLPAPGMDDPDARRAWLQEEAARILANRADDGSWSGEAGKVLATCDAVDRLGRLARALKELEPKDGAARSAVDLPPASEVDREDVQQVLVRGREFLLDEAVAPGRWGFSGRADPGITAMVAGALAHAPASPERDAALGRALDYLVSLQKEDGSIHEGQLANYVTSASVLALVAAGRPEDEDVVARAREYLVRLQADEGEGYSPADRFYGGVGYGGDERPDLSNLQMALEALDAAGVPSEDAAFQRALTFLQRCQNRSESNDLELTVDGVTYVSGNDGGAGYTPGDSKAGFVTLRDGTQVPRSYGSMTYALLKGYLFAGLPKDDPRVEAAWKWLTENYTLDVNPGFEASSDPTAAYQGLFYYYTTMARALDLYGQETILDGSGREHDWRDELLARLVAMQRQDGSWVNANAPRWYEGNPVLATAYAMIAMHWALDT